MEQHRGAASLQQRQRGGVGRVLCERGAAVRQRFGVAPFVQQQLGEVQPQFQGVGIAFDRSRQLTN
jgi:hypothetical protein